jgi:hypothetical protein
MYRVLAGDTGKDFDIEGMALGFWFLTEEGGPAWVFRL